MQRRGGARPSGAQDDVARPSGARRGHAADGIVPLHTGQESGAALCVHAWPYAWMAGAVGLARSHACTQDVHSWSHAWPYAWMAGAVGLARPMTAWRFAACAVRWFAARGGRCPVASPNPPIHGKEFGSLPSCGGPRETDRFSQAPAGGGEGGGLACHRAAVRRTAT